MVTYTAEETINPTRTIPRSLMIGIAIVTVCYIGLNAVYLRVLPIEKVMTSARVAADTFEVLVGAGGAGVIAALVMFSAFGALNGIVMMGPRVYYQIAQDGLMFGWFSHLHPTFQTPDRAIILQAIWSSVLVLTGSYRALFTRVIYTEWIFFALLALGVVLLRRRPGYAPAWRMPLVPLAPIVFVIVSLLIVVNQIRADLHQQRDRFGDCRLRNPGILSVVTTGQPGTLNQTRWHMKIDFHNHYYPPDTSTAVKKGPTKVRMDYDA